MKILFVVNDAGFFLSHRLPIALAAKARGDEVHVAAPADAAVAEISRQGLFYHDIPLTRRGANPFREALGLIALARLFREVKPDLIHLVTIKPVLYGGLAARLTGIRAVVSAVSGLGYVFIATGLKAALLRFFVRKFYRVALGHPRSRVIFQNPDDRDAFRKWGLIRDEQAVLIKGAGVSASEYNVVPEPAGTCRVVLASRLLWDKGVGEFVEAARLLKQQGVAAKFILAGDTDPGNPAAIPRATLLAWHESGIVDWLGHQKNMPELLTQSHIVCLPSYREGLPKVLIEAASCGRAIVTTDVPGCREIVQNGHNGLLVPARNVSNLQAALVYLISHPTERQRMGELGRQMVLNDFTIEIVVKTTLAVYSELAAC